MGGLSKLLGRALLKNTKKGAKLAEVKRPGQIALEESKTIAPDELPKVEPLDAPKVADDGVMENIDGSFTSISKGESTGRWASREEAEAALKKADVVPDVAKKPASVAKKKTKQEPVIDLDDAVAVEAKRIQELDFGKYDTDEAFQMNFDTINTTKGIQAVIADVASNNRIPIDEARRGKITHEQMRGWAKDTGNSEETVIKLMSRQKGDAANAETIVAARMVLHSSAARIYSLSKKVYKGMATVRERLQFRRQMQFHREFQNNFMGARAEAGRAVNAFRVPTAAEDIDLARVMELIDSGAGHDTDTIARAIALMPDGNVTAVSKTARKYTQSKFMGVVNEMFVNSILSGPRTHIINTSGNIMMPWMHMTETSWAARIGKFLPAGDHVVVGEASAMLHGHVQAFQDAFVLLARTARTGVALDDVVKFEGLRRRSISAEHLLEPKFRATQIGRLVEGILDGGKVGPVPIPGLGSIIRSPTERVMLPVDEFFKTLAYRSEIERQAFKHVYDNISSGAAKMEEAEVMIREFMENAPVKAIKAAEDYARYVTFQNPLGPAGQKAQAWINAVPGLKLLAPFVRTPVNIFKAGILDRSPVGLLTPSFWRAMKAGGRERDMMLSRVSIGTATSLIAAKMTMEGFITGGGPRNADARRLLEMTGWQPYSMHFGNRYKSFARLEPLAYVLGAVADAVEIGTYISSDVETMQDEEVELNNAVAAIIMGITNNTMSKTYLRGLAGFMDMMTDPDRNFNGWTKSMTSALVPFSALRAQMGQIDDPYMREAWTILENLKVRSGIPGWSEDAPTRKDLFGHARKHKRGNILGPMSPMPDTTDPNDPVLNELVRIMELTRRVPVTMPSKRVDGMRLSVWEYDELVAISRTEPDDKTGMTFPERLDDLMYGDLYDDATADGKIELIKTEQRAYDKLAREELEERNPFFAERIAAHRLKRKRLEHGEE